MQDGCSTFAQNLYWDYKYLYDVLAPTKYGYAVDLFVILLFFLFSATLSIKYFSKIMLHRKDTLIGFF